MMIRSPARTSTVIGSDRFDQGCVNLLHHQVRHRWVGAPSISRRLAAGSRPSGRAMQIAPHRGHSYSSIDPVWSRVRAVNWKLCSTHL